MNPIHEVEVLFGNLVVLSLQASLLVLIVGLVIRLSGKAFSLAARYALWLLVLLRLLLPVAPRRPCSIHNLFVWPDRPSARNTAQPAPVSIAAVLEQLNQPFAGRNPATASPSRSTHLRPIQANALPGRAAGAKPNTPCSKRA